MSDLISCPTRQDLEKFIRGQVPDADVQPLEKHILGCAKCAQHLGALQADDPFAAALRSGISQSLAESPTAKVLMERLIRDRPEGAPGATRLPSKTEHGSKASGSNRSPVALAPALGPDEIGRLGPYRVLEIIGSGGMGVVFRAHDPQLDRIVALKAMLPEAAAQPDAHQRFMREARSMARLKNDHIVTIHRVDEHQGVPFLAMECLHGESLDSWLRRGKQMSIGQVLRVGREICQGLAAAHAVGLVHRDIKPANVWLEAPKSRVKILDFGLARGGARDIQLTPSGAIVGTPAFMSPEQGRGEPADARSDLFSLGCVLYRLLTGKLPFNGRTTTAVLAALATTDPAPVQEVNPRVPEALAALVKRLLAKGPEERPQSASRVLRELQRIERQRAKERLGPPAEKIALSEPSLPVTRPGIPRRWLIAAAVALAGLCGLVLVGFILFRT